MVGREDDGVWVTLKETIHASPADVASCIANATGFCRWLAVACEFEGGAGSTLAISWDRDWQHSTELKVLDHDADLALDGHARIRFEWFPNPIDDTPIPVEVTVTPLAERGDGTAGARVILRHGPFPADADALIFMADSAESWRWYLCNLRSVLEQKHDMRAVRPL
ncbi:MAG: SRPBCC domain-containing protein [Planctomycetaceae bacterium]|jgi:hypothetical protein|nr:SRPBCC domain-containing protein [Planctomycetaceae bacterium]